jgi:aryl-alcohol dehydrogenase-like predicted oxidoreductase
MEQIAALLSESGHSALELALGYVLQYREVSAALCGIRNSGQLAGAIDALAHLPPPDIIEKARAIADATVQHYHAEKEKHT